MRRTAALLLLPALLPALAACGGAGGQDQPTPAPTSSAPAPPSEEDDPEEAPGGGSSAGAAPATTPACARVRAGIDAFNDGDYEETVDRFVEAVPLAEEQLDGSEEAQALLEAVEWYAALPPEDYPEAAISSQEFQVYKAITLTQCDPVPGGAAPSTPPPVEA